MSAMKAELRVPNPCLHWQAVALMLERRKDFREDVTMVVEPDRLRFVDSTNRELRSLPREEWIGGEEIPSLDTTVSLLDWIEEEFPEEAAS